MTSRPPAKRKKKERTWAEAATIALSNFPPRPVTTKEIMNYIYEHKLKDIKHTKASENVLKTMLCHHSGLPDCPFYKIKGKNGFYRLKNSTASIPKLEEGSKQENTGIVNEVEPIDDSMVTRGRSTSTTGSKSRNLTPLDLETPSSVLTNTKIKAVINSTTFSVFPPAYQHLLIKLLPTVDQITHPDHALTMSQTALSNEFFSQALQEWFNRLCEGEFTRETQARIMQEVAKERNKIDPWKIEFFEEYYGQRSGNEQRRRSVDMTADLPDLSFDAQVEKFEHLRNNADDTPVFGKHDVKSPMMQFCDLSTSSKKPNAEETTTSAKVHSTLYRHPTGCESPLYEDDYSSEEETLDEYHEEIEDEEESDTSIEESPMKKRKQSHDDVEQSIQPVVMPTPAINHTTTPIVTLSPQQPKSPVVKSFVKRTRTLAEIKAQMKARRAAALSTRYVPSNTYEETAKYVPCEMEYSPQCDTRTIPQYTPSNTSQYTYTPSNTKPQDTLSEPSPAENTSPSSNAQKIVLKIKAVTGDSYSVKMPSGEVKKEPPVPDDPKVALLSVSPVSRSPVFGETPFAVGTQISTTTHNTIPSNVRPFMMTSAPVGFEDITPKGDAKIATPVTTISNLQSNSFTQQQSTLNRAKFRTASAGKSLLQMQELAKTTQMLSSESEIAESESENDESPSSPESNAESTPVKTDIEREDDVEMGDDIELASDEVVIKCLCRCEKLVLCKGCGAYTHQECLTATKLCSLCA